jgi:trehalose 6-phosphate phosphatase
MKILLLLDYDGTLTPLRRRPELARLSPTRLAFLKKLAKDPRITLAIISGRSLSSLKKMVPVSGVVLVGNHGLEMERAGKIWRHPTARGFTRQLKKIIRTLTGPLKEFSCAWLEDKGVTVSLHYRQLDPALAVRFLRRIKKELRALKIKHRLTAGKKVLEIRPPVDWDKGKAALLLLRRYPDHLPLCLGDDVTDEDLFARFKRTGLSFKVGPGPSRADLRLSGVAEVYRFLKLL